MPTFEPSRSAGTAPRPFVHGLWAAIRFLFSPNAGPHQIGESDRFHHAASWFVPIGLMIGLLWAGGFRLAWRLYGETAGLRILPALTVVLIECLLTGGLLCLGLARTAHALGGAGSAENRLDARLYLGPAAMLILCLAVLSQWVLIASIPSVSPWWPQKPDWRSYLNFAYPAPVYRPLVLAPVWGRWGILLAASIGRTAHHADPPTVALCAAMRPTRVLKWAIVPTAFSAIYFARQGNVLIGVVMAMIVFAVTYIAAVVMARGIGGQTRSTLFAAGQIAQLVFLAVYRAFWPLIHG